MEPQPNRFRPPQTDDEFRLRLWGLISPPALTDDRIILFEDHPFRRESDAGEFEALTEAFRAARRAP